MVAWKFPLARRDERAAAARRRRQHLEDLESRILLSSVGGGFVGAGITGHYFNNATLSGQPTFARSDERIDFDWGTTIAPGGSMASSASACARHRPGRCGSTAWTIRSKSRPMA